MIGKYKTKVESLNAVFSQTYRLGEYLFYDPLCTGKQIVTLVPFPGWDSKNKVPPCSFIIFSDT